MVNVILLLLMTLNPLNFKGFLVSVLSSRTALGKFPQRPKYLRVFHEKAMHAFNHGVNIFFYLNRPRSIGSPNAPILPVTTKNLLNELETIFIC